MSEIDFSLWDCHYRPTVPEMVAVMQAYDSGSKVECLCRGDEEDTWDELRKPSWSWDEYNYRPVQQPSRVPLEQSDFLGKPYPIDLLRHSSSLVVRRILRIGPTGLSVLGADLSGPSSVEDWTFESLDSSDWEFWDYQSAEWVKCSKSNGESQS